MSRHTMNLIRKHVKTNIVIYFLVIFCLLIGISVGGFTVKIVDIKDKQALISYLKGFFALFHSKSIRSIDIFLQSLINNIQMLTLCYILGISIIGIIGVFFVIAFKGFIIGFTVGILIEQFKIKGSLLFLLGVLPQNLIIIPVFIVASVISISFALSLIKNKLNKTGQINIWENILMYTIKYLILCILILLAALTESMISPIFIKIVSTYIY